MKRLFGATQDAHIGSDLLSAYLDGQVTAAELDRVTAHMQGCAQCRSEADSLRQTIMLLQALPRVSVPRAFTLSEAQVGIRRPGAQPAWLGGLVRGLGVVTAVALVAFVTTTLLRQQTDWTPSVHVARVAPAAEMPATEPAVAAMAAPAEEVAPAVAMAPAAAPAEGVEEESAAPPVATEVALLMEAPAEADASPATPQEAQMKAAGPEDATEAGDASAAFAVEEPQLTPMPPPASRGLDGAAAAMAELPLAALTPALAPAMVSADAVLPAGAGFAFADGQTLSVLDGASGLRKIATAPGIQMPIVSDARDRIAYRVQEEDGLEIWTTSWDGKNPSRLLSEGDLAGESIGGQRIQSVEWIPGQARLALVTAAVAAAGELTPRLELWRADAVSGESRRVLEMGPTGRVFYAPDGNRFAVLEYGTREQPEGSLTVYGADGGEGRTVARFPAAPGASSYPTQVQWLPSGDGLLFAAPAQEEGIALYLVGASGEAQLLGDVPAYEAAWSADGSQLAYSQPVEGSPVLGSLVLAGQDGSDPQPYAQWQSGEFLGWSPNGEEFLYTADNQVYIGAPGREPMLLGNSVSVHDPYWVAPEQVVSLLDQGAGWMLVWRNVSNGDAGSLAPLPKDISYDFESPTAP